MTWTLFAGIFAGFLFGFALGLIVERHMGLERRWRAEERQFKKVPPKAPPSRPTPPASDLLGRVDIKNVPQGSLLVFESDRLLSREQCDRLRAALEPELSAHGCKAIVVSGGIRATVSVEPSQ